MSASAGSQDVRNQHCSLAPPQLAFFLIEPDLIVCKGLLDAARQIAVAAAEARLDAGYDGMIQIVNLLSDRLDRIEDALAASLSLLPAPRANLAAPIAPHRGQ